MQGTSGTNTTVTATTSAGETNQWISDPATLAVVEWRDGCLGAACSVSFTNDQFGRPTRQTRPEGTIPNTPMTRGNVTEVREVAKPGSGQADIVATASYDANCLNPATCNQPNHTVDPKGNRTDYTYDPTHGGPSKVQMPAPVAGGARPG